ncbi:hypothetical protein HYH03_001837 [Edaphochlamys debaryana]|uniref:Uncharacterized protein n=1 Tax=Edaphochlamys debaryana TaxID=47281 RepID=A0A836C5V6_9CHLO|nr:hypothetical protein HYH03_001837 [Edaphochlamys debaryana]|eukprot:KAG2500259.1 hypothetical protein HYH03_001837 [Edaphochlamys debaryana]
MDDFENRIATYIRRVQICGAVSSRKEATSLAKALRRGRWRGNTTMQTHSNQIVYLSDSAIRDCVDYSLQLYDTADDFDTWYGTAACTTAWNMATCSSPPPNAPPPPVDCDQFCLQWEVKIPNIGDSFYDNPVVSDCKLAFNTMFDNGFMSDLTSRIPNWRLGGRVYRDLEGWSVDGDISCETGHEDDFDNGIAWYFVRPMMCGSLSDYGAALAMYEALQFDESQYDVLRSHALAITGFKEDQGACATFALKSWSGGPAGSACEALHTEWTDGTCPSPGASPSPGPSPGRDA